MHPRLSLEPGHDTQRAQLTQDHYASQLLHPREGLKSAIQEVLDRAPADGHGSFMPGCVVSIVTLVSSLSRNGAAHAWRSFTVRFAHARSWRLRHALARPCTLPRFKIVNRLICAPQCLHVATPLVSAI